ncbi:MAG TPA: ferritin-like domain-containing protein [Solirubrobacteraceae bacterium]|nr:ferritin-like domain-containing protein [Solirubrobacteraceae bacterium]
MTDVTQSAVSRGQFIKNGAKGSLVLVGAGGALATMDGVAFAKGVTKSDIATLQVGYIAESLAVKVYSTIIDNFSSFKGLKNKDYFVAALKNEVAHKQAWKDALGAKHTPKGFRLHIPSAAVKSTKALTSTGVALEAAFVSTYLGAVNTFSSTALKEAAAAVAANEASHFSFFDAANGGHGVLPSFPKPLAASKAAAILTKDGFIS